MHQNMFLVVCVQEISEKAVSKKILCKNFALISLKKCVKKHNACLFDCMFLSCHVRVSE